MKWAAVQQKSAVPIDVFQPPCLPGPLPLLAIENEFSNAGDQKRCGTQCDIAEEEVGVAVTSDIDPVEI